MDLPQNLPDCLIACDCERLACGGQRKSDLEARSFTQFAFDVDVAAVITNDAVAERVVDLRQVFGRDAEAGVPHADHDGILIRPGRNFELASARHGVARVEDQVHQHLLQLGRVAGRERQAVGVVTHDLDLGVAQLRLEQLDRVVKDAVQINRRVPRLTDAREIEQVVDD
jgi:hypothetical protein